MFANIKQNYNSLCSPARVYLILTGIWLLLSYLLNQNFEENTVCTLVYSFVWIFILNLLCKKSEKLAWGVFLVPIFIHIIIMLFWVCFLGSASAELMMGSTEDCNCDNKSLCDCNKGL